MSPTQQQRPIGPQKKLPTFEVLDFKSVGQGNLLGFATVKIGPITVKEFRLVQQPGQAPWVAPPQRSWVDDATGQRKYLTLIEMPKEWRNPLTNAVVTAWKEQQREGGIQ